MAASSGSPSDAPEHVASPESLYAIIDEALMQVLDITGWPIWHTPGGGSDEPSKKACNFVEDKLTWCARIDFRRGTATDDVPNIKCFRMLAQLPGYGAVLTKQQDPSSM